MRHPIHDFSNILPPTLIFECLGVLVFLTLDHILKINSLNAPLNMFSLGTVLTTKVLSSSEYVDIEFHPILPSSALGPESITHTPNPYSQTHGTSIMCTFPAAAVTSHDPCPATPLSPLHNTSSTSAQPFLQTYSRRPHIHLSSLVPAPVPITLNPTIPAPRNP
ncbi:unnamed protein product [Prunus armeniaca]